MPSMTQMGVPGTAEAWRALGFVLDGNVFVLDGVRFDVGRDPSWGFDELDGDADGLSVATHAIPPPSLAPDHPNLIDRIDHVVYAVPDLDAACETLDGLGFDLRRRFNPRGPDGPEMAFYRAGTVIEVVAGPPKAGLWGIAFLCPDLDATVDAMRGAGAPIGDPKRAIQGGRIASVWKEHVGWGVAVMEPERG